MITATMVSNDGKTAEFDVRMDAQTRRLAAKFNGMDGTAAVFHAVGEPVAIRYRTGTKRHSCPLNLYVLPCGTVRALAIPYVARIDSHVHVVGWYDAADPRNARNNLA